MKVCDVVGMKSAVVQFGGAKVRGSMTMKAMPGKQLMFLYLGGFDPENPPNDRMEACLRYMGWIPGPELQAQIDAEHLRAADAADAAMKPN